MHRLWLRRGGRSKAKKPAPQDSVQQQEGQEGSEQLLAAGQATGSSSVQAGKEQQQQERQGSGPAASAAAAGEASRASKEAAAEPAGPEAAGGTGAGAEGPSSSSVVLSAIREEVLHGTAYPAARISPAQPASTSAATGSTVMAAIAEQLQSKQPDAAGIELAPASSEGQWQQSQAAPTEAGASSTQQQAAGGKQGGQSPEPVLQYLEDGRLSEYVRAVCSGADGVLDEAQTKELCAALGEPLLEVPLQRLRRRKLRKLKVLRD
jgi:hypothetical protein